MYDIAIKCGYFLDVSGRGPTGKCDLKTNQVIGINGSKIAAVQDLSKAGVPAAKKVIDASQKLVMPGLINGHMHLAMTLFRGLAEDLPFHAWLFDYILPIEANLVDPDFVRVGTELALWECLINGTTTVADMYYFTDEVAAAADKMGFRALVGQTFMDQATPDNKKQDNSSLRILEENLARYKGHERISPVLAPHAPYSCSDELLLQILEKAKHHKIPIMIHVSETKHEVEESLRLFKKTPVKRLYDLGLMSVPSIFAHGIHLTDEDIQLISQSRTGIVHNPESNMKISSGRARIKDLLKAGVAVGLGTDGSASNNNLNLFEEMDSAGKLQKVFLAENVSAKEIVRMATIEGARALGIDSQTGSLEVGKFADIAILDLHQPQMMPLHDVASQLVYSASGREVETVICNGKILMENFKPLFMDTAKITSDTEHFRQKISKFLNPKK